MSRHLARETAFQMLFQMDVGKNDFAMAEHTLGESKLSGGYKAFALDLVNGVYKHNFELNEYLEKFTRGWDIDRLASVDRNLIKMAMYEMLFTETPANIVINEAIEIAKTFGAPETTSFVNAVLDGFYKKVLVEGNDEYKVDEQKILAYEQEIAAAAKRAELMQQEEVIAQAEAEALEEAKTLEKNKMKAEEFAEENKIIKERGFRKIKKADISAKEEIKDDDILSYKKEMYGDDVFFTKNEMRDIRDALDNGAVLPEEVLEKYFSQLQQIEDRKKANPF